MASRPPRGLVRGLVEGPSVVSGVDWREVVDSTNAVAAQAARRGAPEGHLVLTDHQTAGRGRMGRRWQDRPGADLLLSLVLRPAVPPESWTLLPLLVGLSLAEATAPHAPAAQVACKWPNDLLARIGDGAWGKVAGVLLEATGSDRAVVVGVGVNVGSREPGAAGAPPSPDGASSLAALGSSVDRWRLLAGFAGVLSNRYRVWCADPGAFLDDYRRRCVTLGRDVRVSLPRGDDLVGRALGVDGRGALQVRSSGGRTHVVAAGDVAHVR